MMVGGPLYKRLINNTTFLIKIQNYIRKKPSHLVWYIAPLSICVCEYEYVV